MKMLNSRMLKQQRLAPSGAETGGSAQTINAFRKYASENRNEIAELSAQDLIKLQLHAPCAALPAVL